MSGVNECSLSHSQPLLPAQTQPGLPEGQVHTALMLTIPSPVPRKEQPLLPNDLPLRQDRRRHRGASEERLHHSDPRDPVRHLAARRSVFSQGPPGGLFLRPGRRRPACLRQAPKRAAGGLPPAPQRKISFTRHWNSKQKHVSSRLGKVFFRFAPSLSGSLPYLVSRCRNPPPNHLGRAPAGTGPAA